MTLKIAIIPAALLLMASLAACDTAEERAEKHFQSALALIQEGDFERARVEFRNVFELDGTHQEARRSLAEMLEETGDLRGAQRQYLFLVEQDPNDGPATLKLAQISLQTNRWDEVERYGNTAIKLLGETPETREIMLNLNYRDAVLERDAQARAQVARDAEAFMAAHPDSLRLSKILLDWYSFEGRDRDALAMVDKALELAPRDLGLYQARLSVLNRLGETPEIERQLRDMVTRFPGEQTVRRALFGWLMQNGDVDGAEAFLRDLANDSTDPNQQSQQVALIQFLRQQRGSDAAATEIDARLAAGDNQILFKTLRAGILFDSGDREEAISVLEGVVTNDEVSDELLNAKVTLAKMQLSVGNMVGGRQLVEEVLAADRSNTEAIKMKSEILTNADKASEAIVLLRTGLEANPDDPQLYTLMARAYDRNGERDLMGDMLARAAEASNQAPTESMTLANFLSGRRQYAPAEQTLVESLRRNPNDMRLLNALGRLYLRMEKPAEASQVEDTLRRLDTEQSIAAADGLRLGILQLQNRSEDMIALIEGIGSRTSNTSRTVIALMRTHLAQGNPQKAREVIDNAYRDDPSNMELRFARTVLLSADGEFDEARAEMRAILEQEPAALNVWMSLARTHSSNGDFQAAEAVIDEALTAIPDNPTLVWTKAGYLERRGDIGGAIDIYEKLYDDRSSSVIAANNLASLLTSYRETPETVERAYAIARRLRGLEQPAFQDTYGWIAFLRGEFDDALEHLEPAAEGLPGDPLVQYHLGRLYQELGRNADAAAQYEKALEVLGGRTNEAMTDAADRLAAVKPADN